MYFVHKYYHETLAGNDEKRHNFTELFRRKQLNLGHARLCIHDQATTHYDEIIDHMTAGMRLAFDLFEEEPRVGWAMDAFGHSYTNIYKTCISDAELHIGLLTHHDVTTGTLSRDAQTDVKDRSLTLEKECRAEIQNASILDDFVPCFNLDNNNACILELFNQNQNLEFELKNGSQIMLKIFNPGKTQDDFLTF